MPMKNWKAIAEAGGFDIPAAELDRIAEPLRALEKSFRPLVEDLEPELEPLTVLRAEDDE
jgi:hypothetical protein